MSIWQLQEGSSVNASDEGSGFLKSFQKRQTRFASFHDCVLELSLPGKAGEHMTSACARAH